MDLIDDLRRGALATLAKILLIAILAVTLANLASFTRSTDDALSQGFSESAQVNLYGLTDRLADPDRFSEFRASPEAVAGLTRFWDELDASDRIDLLSVFDQPVPVRGPRADVTFDHAFGTDSAPSGVFHDEYYGGDVLISKAIELNRAAFDFFGLTVGAGTDAPALDWSAVNYSGDSVPVLLGSAYREHYAVGDTLVGDYYMRTTTFRVAGFLTPHSSIYYQGEMTYDLDHHILVPYPPTASALPTSEPEFRGIVAFAMLGSQIAADPAMTQDEVLDILASASASSGFTEYTVLGVADYLIQFGFVKKLITDNLALVVLIEVLLVLSVVLAATAINRYVHRRRRGRLLIAWTLGKPRTELARTVAGTVAVEYLVALICALVLVGMLPNGDIGAFGVVVAAIAVAGILDTGVLLRMLTHTLVPRPGGTR